MNIRQKYELKMLYEDGCLDMSKTAGVFSVNLRTIRYDIQILNDYLYTQLQIRAIHVNNKMAFVEEHVRESISKYEPLEARDFYTEKLSSEERMYAILFELCWEDTFSTIQSLADKYFVSRTTLNNDIIEIKKYCSENKIPFVSNRGKGLHIEGDELERRKYLARVIGDFTLLKMKKDGKQRKFYLQWFDSADLGRIKQIVKTVEKNFETYLADVEYEALVVHIALSIKRYHMHNHLQEKVRTSTVKLDSVQYRMAEDIIKRINEAFQIELPEPEMYYVAFHIGTKSSMVHKKENEDNVYLEYYTIKLISEVSRRLPYNLTNDKMLYNSLIQHLIVCIYRRKNNVHLENPLKTELMQSYPSLYRMVKEVLENMPDFIILTDDEITYILLYFATAISRIEQHADQLANAVVVCATGIGTSQLVAAGLEKNFCLNIEGMVASHQLDDFLKKHPVDIIISTVPLQTDQCCVHVSPFLNREDIVEIGKKLLEMGFDIGGMTIGNGLLSDTAKYLKYLLANYSEKDQELELIAMLNKYFKYHKIKKERNRYMLSELLTEERIHLDVACSDWQGAVRMSGAPLVETQAITEEYIQAVIDNVNKVGPYIVITKGVALPHATNKVGVNKTAISMVRLSTPVNFGNEFNDPVKYLFMLSTTDADSHLDALRDLSEFLDREEFMRIIKNAVSPCEIISYIRNNETIL